MDLFLQIGFNSRIIHDFTIKNPSYVPNMGEIVNFKPEDFLKDKKDIKAQRKFDNGQVWYVGFKVVSYEKNAVKVLIVLEEEEHYYEGVREHHQKIFQDQNSFF